MFYVLCSGNFKELTVCWCSLFGNGLASLERLDKIECWLAQGDRGSGVVTGRGAEIGPSIRSVPQRAGANSGRAAAQEGVYAQNAWRLNGGVDGCHVVELYLLTIQAASLLASE